MCPSKKQNFTQIVQLKRLNEEGLFPERWAGLKKLRRGAESPEITNSWRPPPGLKGQEEEGAFWSPVGAGAEGKCCWHELWPSREVLPQHLPPSREAAGKKYSSLSSHPPNWSQLARVSIDSMHRGQPPEAQGRAKKGRPEPLNWRRQRMKA